MANGCPEEQFFTGVFIAHLASGSALLYKKALQSGGSANLGTSSDDVQNEKEKPRAAKRRRTQIHSSTDDKNGTAFGTAEHLQQTEKGSSLPLRRSQRWTSPRLVVDLNDVAETVPVVHSQPADGHR